MFKIPTPLILVTVQIEYINIYNYYRLRAMLLLLFDSK
jgi:hypothetical protein